MLFNRDKRLRLDLDCKPVSSFQLLKQKLARPSYCYMSLDKSGLSLNRKTPVATDKTAKLSSNSKIKSMQSVKPAGKRTSGTLLRDKLSSHSVNSLGRFSSSPDKSLPPHEPFASTNFELPRSEAAVPDEKESRLLEEIERLKLDKERLRSALVEAKAKLKQTASQLQQVVQQKMQTEERAIEVVERLKAQALEEITKLGEKARFASEDCGRWKERALKLELKEEQLELELEKLPSIVGSLTDFRKLMEKMSELLLNDIEKYRATFHEIRTQLDYGSSVQRTVGDFFLNHAMQNLTHEIRYLFAELKSLHKNIEKVCC